MRRGMQIAQLDGDADHVLLGALETMRRATPGKQMLKALKAMLPVLGGAGGLASTDTRYVPLLVELAFLENASALYRCYFNSIKGFSDVILDQVMRGWVSKLEGGVELDSVGVLELTQTILGVERFQGIWVDILSIGMQHVSNALEMALREAAGEGFDDAGDRLVEKAASIGYAFVTKDLPIDQKRLENVLDVAIQALKVVEERKVEYMLAHLVGGLGCALAGRQAAVHAVLCSCFGESSDVVELFNARIGYRSSVKEDAERFYDSLCRLQASTSSRTFAVCATMGQILYEEVSRAGLVSEFSENFAIAACAVVEGEHSHTPFVRLYCVDALSAYLGTYLRLSEKGLGMLSQGTKMRVVDTLALRSMSCHENVARRIADGFFRVMFEYDAFQEQQLGEPATLAVHAITVCANMPASKAKFRLWDAILRHVPVPEVIRHCPGFLVDTMGVISVDMDVRSAASSALKHVWKNIRPVSVGFTVDSAQGRPDKECEEGCFSSDESEGILGAIADMLVDADLRNDGSLDSMTNYVLSGLLESCPSSFMVLMRRVQQRDVREHAAIPLGSCIGMLSVGKRTGCFGSFSDLEQHGINAYTIIGDAVVNSRESVQLAALELVCTGSISTIDIPNDEELDIVWKYFNASMICTSALARVQNITCFVRFLSRIKASAAAILTRPRDFGTKEHEAVLRCESWLQKFCRLCIVCLHPGAVYGKKLMAIELLCAAMDVFADLISEEPTRRRRDRTRITTSVAGKYQCVGSGLKYGSLRPFPDALFSAPTRDLLYGALADNFDRIRSVAMTIILMLPPPIVQRTTDEMSPGDRNVRDLLEYAFEYVRRPRLTDIDAGSRMINIVHNQFLIPGTWRVDLRSIDDFDVIYNEHGETTGSLEFVGELSSVAIKATPDLESLGTLLAYLALLRHLVSSAVFDSMGDIETFMKLVQLVEHTVQLIMPVLSNPEENVIDGNEMGGGEGEMEHSLAELLESRASKEQLIRCRSWMASREICVMIQSLWVAVPSGSHGLFMGGLRRTVDAVMDVLLGAQHYGSIYSAKEALQHICSTRGPSIAEDITHPCVDFLFEQMLRPGQSRRNAIRRSGGMPFGLQSVMVSNPKSRISAVIMERLLEIGESDTASGGEVYWPKVHALNALRLVFSDPRLSVLERYHGKGFRIVLQCLSDPSWEVQNSAALCFTSLVVSKVMGGGAANVRRVDHVDIWPIHALSAEGFLGRYREVDQFMVDVLERRRSDELLAPVLALLGRLKPELSSPSQSSDPQDTSSAGMETIKQYRDGIVRHLGSHQIYIRKLAARACVSVVPAVSWLDLLVRESCNTKDLLDAVEDPNPLHGRLCLMVEVFKAMHSLPHHAGNIHDDLFRAIVECFCESYGKESLLKTMPAACYAELLKVCTLLCRLEANVPDSRVLAFCAKVVDTLWEPIMNQRSMDSISPPMCTVSMKRIVKLSLVWLLPAQINEESSSLERYLEWVARLAAHQVYEVREAALKSLLARNTMQTILDRSAVDNGVSRRVDQFFRRVADSWEAEPAYYAQLAMLRVTNAAKVGALQGKNAQCLLKHRGNPLLLAEIVRSTAYGEVMAAEDLLPETCQPHQIEEIRAASVDALDAVDLSLPSGLQDTGRRLDVWAAALTLMMDEEVSIRTQAAFIVQRALGNGAPTQREEIVQEKIFPWLLQESGCSFPVVQFCIRQIVHDPAAAQAELLGHIEARDRHRLFLIEKANQHEDPLVYANLAANALLGARTRISTEASELVREWGTACAEALIHIIDVAKSISGSLNFGTELGLRQRMYEEMYRLHLAVRVAATVGFVAKGISPPPPMQQIIENPWEQGTALLRVDCCPDERADVSPRLAVRCKQ